MTTKQALKYFKGIKHLAAALGVWPQAVYKWGKYPPIKWQFKIHEITKGKLKMEQPKEEA